MLLRMIVSIVVQVPRVVVLVNQGSQGQAVRDDSLTSKAPRVVSLPCFCQSFLESIFIPVQDRPDGKLCSAFPAPKAAEARTHTEAKRRWLTGRPRGFSVPLRPWSPSLAPTPGKGRDIWKVQGRPSQFAPSPTRIPCFPSLPRPNGPPEPSVPANRVRIPSLHFPQSPQSPLIVTSPHRRC